MSQSNEQKVDYRALMSKALTEIKELKGELARVKDRQQEPIAVIGASCRLPGGVVDLDTYWKMLSEGRDAVSRVPADRWDADAYYDPDHDAPGKICTRDGGFIDQPVRDFDAAFFSISPREAESMDPQQRLLLELCWEAVEHANILPESLFNQNGGVFIGVSGMDNVTRIVGEGAFSALDAYTGTGTALSPTAGRISYYFGLTGPSYIVDTACSSSMLSVHLACESLRQGECDFAMAGGIQLLTHPGISIAFSKAHMLSVDGRCKTFDASANGYVRGEGGGVILLKRLSDAQRDGDRILAVIRGSAVNQDGPSGGLTVPSGPSQEAVIREALRRAGVHPSHVNYVEAHGTGTSLGDPIEVGALAKVYGVHRTAEDPLHIASVKTNIGHLEAGAGIASIIKVVLSLMHRQITPHLHFREPNPMIEWDRVPIHVPSAMMAWNPPVGVANGAKANGAGGAGSNGANANGASQARRMAGTSSFGFAGTNVHIILEESPDGVEPALAENPSEVASTPAILPISAKSVGGLRDLAHRYGKLLEDHPDTWRTIAHTAATCRTAFRSRLAVVADSSASAREVLSRIDFEDAAGSGWAKSDLREDAEPVVGMLFTGQGAQFAGMGQDLYVSEPTFRNMVDACCAIIDPMLGLSLKEVMFENKTLLDRTLYTQPALFTLEVALAALWKAKGGRIDAVIGHSVGEYAAAVVAGMLKLEDGAKLITRRAQLMDSLPEGGAMMAILEERARVEELIAGMEDPAICIAAANSPRNLVVSGPAKSLDGLQGLCEREQVEVRRLVVSHAFHSAMMDPILDAFRNEMVGIRFTEPQIPIFCNATGENGSILMRDPDYWVRHIRGTVRFEEGFRSMLGYGVDLLVEAGPKPTLLSMGRVIAEDADAAVHMQASSWIPLGRPISDEHPRPFLQALATYWTKGGQLDWDAVNGTGDSDLAHRTPKADLPLYPFQRVTLWKDIPFGDDRFEAAGLDALHGRGVNAVIDSTAGDASPIHPLLGRRFDSPLLEQGERLHQQTLTRDGIRFLDHHKVFDRIVLPAAAHMEMALSASDLIFRESDGRHRKGRSTRAPGRSASSHVLELRDVTIDRAFVLPEQGPLHVQTLLRKRGEGHDLEIHTRAEEADGWVRHTSGVTSALPVDPGSILPADDLDAILTRCSQPYSVKTYYHRTREIGVDHGEDFQAMTSLAIGKDEVIGKLELPKPLLEGMEQFQIHPVLLDAAFHMVSVPLIDLDRPYLPVGLDRMVLHRQAGSALWCHISAPFPDPDAAPTVYTADIALYDESGFRVAEIQGLRYQRIEQDLFRDTDVIRDAMYGLSWEPRPLFGVADPELATTEAILERLDMQRRIGRGECEFYGDLFADFDLLSSGYVRNALVTGGWTPGQGERISTVDLSRRLGVKAEFEALFERCLGMLQEDGYLARDPETDLWTVERPLDAMGPELAEEVSKRHPQAMAEWTLFTRCASRLREVWRGDIDPLSLLFPSDGDTVTTLLYQQAIGSRVINSLMGKAVGSALASLPESHGLKVLEIGGGTGGTTLRVLPELPADRTDYLFTDISAHFTRQAEKQFSPTYPFLRTALLDVEQAPSEEMQGQFDLILAANVLHATQDLSQTLHHCHDMLAPGGMLVLLEASGKQRWFDLTFGMTDGWWRFKGVDGFRKDYPLLDSDGWRRILPEAGFTDTCLVDVDPEAVVGGKGGKGGKAGKAGKAGDTPRGTTLSQTVVMARRPARKNAAIKRLDEHAWLVVGEHDGTAASSLMEELGEGAELVSAVGLSKGDARAWETITKALDAATSKSALTVVMTHAIDMSVKPADDKGVSDPIAGIRQLVEPILSYIKVAHQHDGSVTPRLILLTQGTVMDAQADANPANKAGADTQGDPLASLVGSTLHGLIRTLATENPSMRPLVVDVEPGAPKREWIEILSRESQIEDGEPIVMWRSGRRHVLRLVESGAVDLGSPDEIKAIDAQGAYLITGGFGAIGLRSASMLASKGVRHLILIGRSGPSAEAQEVLAQLQSQGVTIETYQLDVSDLEALRPVFDRKKKRSISGILHCAGILNDGVLSGMSWDTFESVLHAKVAGAWNLHELSFEAGSKDLRMFILFSSIGSLLGPPAQANYAAANAFLDQLAHHRRSLGLPALSLNWGIWSDVGLGASRSDRSQTSILNGLKAIEPAQGIAMLEQLLSASGQIAAVPIIWPKLIKEMPSMTLLDHFRDVDSDEEQQDAKPQDWAQRLAGLSPGMREEVVMGLVRERVGKVLGADPQSLDVRAGFFDLGMDSLTSVEMRNSLQSTLKINLPSTLIFKYPNIEAVTGFLLEELMPSDGSDAGMAMGSAPAANASEPTASVSPAASAKAISEMSEDDLNALIDAELRNL